jgi:quinohemoprotein ethanol dehydrogenase
LKGVLAPAGMERFDDILSEQDVDNIHAYLISQSWVAYRAQEAAAGHGSAPAARAEAATAHP